jgi:hypothetical protein
MLSELKSKVCFTTCSSQEKLWENYTHERDIQSQGKINKRHKNSKWKSISPMVFKNPEA